MCEKVIIPEKYIKKSDSGYETINNFQSWQEVQTVFKLFLDGWIFRGQRCSEWELIPSIMRHMKEIDPDSFEPILVDIAKNKIKSQGEPSNLPKTELGWRAFIQHYGGKTRLLDFTTDSYIATFFAFALDQKNIKESDKECAVWVINRRWLEKKASQKIEQKLGHRIENNNFSSIFETIIETDQFFPMVCPFVADWHDQRVRNQKSIFLCQCDPCESFEDNLCNDQIGSHYEDVDTNYKEIESYVKKIFIPIEFRADVIKSLESKNISTKTMLPGMNRFQYMEKIIKQAEADAFKRRASLLDEIKKRKNRKP